MKVDSPGTKPKEKNKIITDGVTNIVQENIQEPLVPKDYEVVIGLSDIPSVFDNVHFRKSKTFEPPQRIKGKKELYIDKLNENRREAVGASYCYQRILENKNSSRSSKWDAEKKLESCKQDCEKIDAELFELGCYKSKKPWDVNDPVASLIGELSVDYRFYSAEGENFTKFFVNQLNQYFLEDTFFSSLSHLENYEEEFLNLWNSKYGKERIKKALNLNQRCKNLIKLNLSKAFRNKEKAERRFEACKKFAEKCKKSLADKKAEEERYQGFVLEDQNLKQNNTYEWLLSHLNHSSEVEVKMDDVIGSLQVNVIDVLKNQMGELTDQKKKDLFGILSKAKGDPAFDGKIGKQIGKAHDVLQEFDKQQTIAKQKNIELRDHADKLRKVITNATIIGQVNADNYDSLSEHDKIKYNLWKKLQDEQKKKEVEVKEQQKDVDIVQEETEEVSSQVQDEEMLVDKVEEPVEDLNFVEEKKKDNRGWWEKQQIGKVVKSAAKEGARIFCQDALPKALGKGARAGFNEAVDILNHQQKCSSYGNWVNEDLADDNPFGFQKDPRARSKMRKYSTKKRKVAGVNYPEAGEQGFIGFNKKRRK